MIEAAELNLAERVVALSEDEISEKLITTLEACDIPDYDNLDIAKEETKAHTLGFAC